MSSSINAFLISIHTPTKGATCAACMILSQFKISIHTPTKGATLLTPTLALLRVFQSTLPQRERRFLARRTELRRDFNPHSHKGSDSDTTKPSPCCFNFNPHSHKGSDRSWKIDRRGYRNFNPHSHKGSDGASSNGAASITIFQSTLPQRERRCLIQKYCWSIFISIHTPTKGATQKVFDTIKP